jgi:hypothetical protein
VLLETVSVARLLSRLVEVIGIDRRHVGVDDTLEVPHGVVGIPGDAAGGGAVDAAPMNSTDPRNLAIKLLSSGQSHPFQCGQLPFVPEVLPFVPRVLPFVTFCYPGPTFHRAIACGRKGRVCPHPTLSRRTGRGGKTGTALFESGYWFGYSLRPLLERCSRAGIIKLIEVRRCLWIEV